MAKKMRRLLAMALALTLCLVQMAVPAMAAGPGDWWWHGGGYPGGGNSSQQEFYIVYLQGAKIAEGAGAPGDVYFLGTHYEAGASVSGGVLNWYIQPLGVSSGPISGSANLADYITIPEGYTVNDLQIEESSISGVNDAVHDMYDNAVITITVRSLKSDSGEVVTLTAATVNHNYYTHDIYTGNTVHDGSVSGSYEALDGSSFTAAPAPDYNGNAYTQTTDASALTITVQADAARNVINIDYLRTVDTTPIPVETGVTVVHNYYTHDVYTGNTALDGSASGTYTATEHDTFTATPVTVYGGNDYAMTTDTSALSITVNADAARNVISMDYLRTIDTSPKATTVTVIHNYYTEDIYTWDYNLDGSSTVTADATEFDTFTATPITSYGGNEYQMTAHENSLILSVNANPDENIIEIDYLRTIDTSPKRTNVTVVHNYYTKDIYTGDTVLDGSGFIINEAKEGNAFTATPISQYEGNDYNVTTDEDKLTITVKADDKKNVIEIDYLRTVDTTPKDYEPVLTIVKSADKVSYEVGETVTWTVTVTNSSEYTAYNVEITDEMTGDVWTVASLAPGASKTFTATSAASAEGALKNIAVATWEDNDEINDADEDEITSISDDATVSVYAPAPVPQSEPEPAPAPAPQPEPQPAPAPQPEPEPAPAPAPQPEPEPAPAPAPQPAPAAGAMLIDIIDEDVPLADVPQTGDASLLWVILSMVSGGGAILLNRKKD